MDNRGTTKTGYLWAVSRDDRGCGGIAPPGVEFHYRRGRKGESAAEILHGFNGTIRIDSYAGYPHLATPKRRTANHCSWPFAERMGGAS